MNARLHQLQLLLARLSPREQRLVTVFSALVGLMLGWSLVVSPFLGGPGRMRRDIDGLRGEISQIESLAAQIRLLEADAPKSGAPEPLPEGFSVLAFVEKAAGASLRAESITSMTPARRPLAEGRQESTVDLKLSSVSLGEMVALLTGIESEKTPVYMKNFSVKRRYDDQSRFDVTLVVAAAVPA